MDQLENSTSSNYSLSYLDHQVIDFCSLLAILEGRMTLALESLGHSYYSIVHNLRDLQHRMMRGELSHSNPSVEIAVVDGENAPPVQNRYRSIPWGLSY